mmetsp:Transcript_2335/g.6259  ORF Transcript_2335/g.6259 Transcript_2335/m.6259 type:complete len:186 (-) Transcript_2335:106-663(-)
MRGTVEVRFRFRASRGCCKISTRVPQSIGRSGSARQMQTASGRWHRGQDPRGDDDDDDDLGFALPPPIEPASTRSRRENTKVAVGRRRRRCRVSDFVHVRFRFRLASRPPPLTRWVPTKAFGDRNASVAGDDDDEEEDSSRSAKSETANRAEGSVVAVRSRFLPSRTVRFMVFFRGRDDRKRDGE